MHAIEAETQIVATLLAYPEQSVSFVCEHIRGEMLLAENALVVASVQKLYITTGRATFMDIVADLRAGGHIEKVGGPARLNELYSIAVVPVGLPYIVAQVRDMFAKRRLLSFLVETQRELETPGALIGPILAYAAGIIEEITTARQAKLAPTIKELTIQAISAMESRANGAGKGISTGVPPLDRITGGVRPSSQWIIAGPPKGGKSSLALTILGSLSMSHGKRCAFYGMEMPSLENVERLLCHDAPASASRARDGDLHEHEYPRLMAASGRVAQAPLHFRDDIFELVELLSSIRQLRTAQPDLFAVFVDYAQLVSAGNEEHREREVAAVSRSLRKLGMQTGLAIMLLSQTNDDGKLRESRTLGMDATKILTLEFDDEPTVRKLRIVQRDGMSGVELRLAYLGDNFKFAELDQEPEATPQPNGKRRKYRP